MLDGKWNLHIRYGGQVGDVPVILNKNSITGDDGHHSYVGSVKTDPAGKTIVEIHVKRHIPGAGPSFNNLDDYILRLVGISTDDSFDGEGGVKDSQNRMFKVRGSRAS